MTEQKEIKTVTAPVLVVEAKEPAAPPHADPNTLPSVLDTQEVRRLILKALEKIPVDEKAIEPPKSPPYLLVILLALLFGFMTVTIIIILRPDLDFMVVTGVIFAIVTFVATSIFGIMKQNQTLAELREANIKAQLALETALATKHMVNSALDAWKQGFRDEQEAITKVATVAAYMDGKQDGRNSANERTDMLAEKTNKPSP